MNGGVVPQGPMTCGSRRQSGENRRRANRDQEPGSSLSGAIGNPGRRDRRRTDERHVPHLCQPASDADDARRKVRGRIEQQRLGRQLRRERQLECLVPLGRVEHVDARHAAGNGEALAAPAADRPMAGTSGPSSSDTRRSSDRARAADCPGRRSRRASRPPLAVRRPPRRRRCSTSRHAASGRPERGCRSACRPIRQRVDRHRPAARSDESRRRTPRPVRPRRARAR